MRLTLEVTSSNGRTLGPRRVMHFVNQGGTVGRTEKPQPNHWQLKADGVSRDHAIVRYFNGVFFIQDDRSTNGVTLNGADLKKGDPQPLNAGDKLVIDVFQVSVSISDDDQVAQPEPEEMLGATIAQPPEMRGRAASLSDFDLDEPGKDPLGLFDLPASMAEPTGSNTSSKILGPGAQRNNSSVLNDFFAPPSSSSQLPGMVEDPFGDLDDLLPPSPPPPPVAPAPQQRQSRPAAAPAAAPPPKPQRAPPPSRVSQELAGSVSFQQILEGAGLHDVQLSPEVAPIFGEIMRVVVEGVMDILRSRDELKSQFRLPTTRAGRTNNNPLKFQPSAEAALESLLVNRTNAYMPPLDAFTDAFTDIHQHQLALLAGIRAGFEATVTRLNPDRLQDEFDRDPRGGGGLMGSKAARNWEQYQRLFRDLGRDSEEQFQLLFGNEFCRAYEQQIQALKSGRR